MEDFLYGWVVILVMWFTLAAAWGQSPNERRTTRPLLWLAALGLLIISLFYARETYLAAQAEGMRQRATLIGRAADNTGGATEVAPLFYIIHRLTKGRAWQGLIRVGVEWFLNFWYG